MTIFEVSWGKPERGSCVELVEMNEGEANEKISLIMIKDYARFYHTSGSNRHDVLLAMRWLLCPSETRTPIPAMLATESSIERFLPGHRITIAR